MSRTALVDPYQTRQLQYLGDFTKHLVACGKKFIAQARPAIDVGVDVWVEYLRPTRGASMAPTAILLPVQLKTAHPRKKRPPFAKVETRTIQLLARSYSPAWIVGYDPAGKFHCATVDEAIKTLGSNDRGWRRRSEVRVDLPHVLDDGWLTGIAAVVERMDPTLAIVSQSLRPGTTVAIQTAAVRHVLRVTTDVDIGTVRSEVGRRLRSQHRAARALLLRGELQAAERAFRRLLSESRRFPDAFPRRWAACNNLGVTLDNLGKQREAERYFRMALKDPRANCDPVLNIGLLHFQKGEHAQARSQLEEARRRGGIDNPGVVNLDGLLCQAEDRLEQALALFIRARELAPRRLEPRLNIGWTLHLLGRHDEARGEFEAALRRFARSPHRWRLHLMLAEAVIDAELKAVGATRTTGPSGLMTITMDVGTMSQCSQPKAVLAAAHLEKARAIDIADRDGVELLLIIAYSLAGDPERSLSVAKGMSSRGVRGQKRLFALQAEAQCHLRMGKFKAALACVIRLARLRAPFVYVQTLRGECHRGLGKVDQALDALMRAARSPKADGVAVMNVAHFALAHGLVERLPEALAELRTLKPDMPEVYLGMVMHAERVGDQGAIRGGLLEYIRLNPRDHRARASLAMKLVGAFRFKDASEHFAKVHLEAMGFQQWLMYAVALSNGRPPMWEAAQKAVIEAAKVASTPDERSKVTNALVLLSRKLPIEVRFQGGLVIPGSSLLVPI